MVAVNHNVAVIHMIDVVHMVAAVDMITVFNGSNSKWYIEYSSLAVVNILYTVAVVHSS